METHPTPSIPPHPPPSYGSFGGFWSMIPESIEGKVGHRKPSSVRPLPSEKELILKEGVFLSHSVSLPESLNPQ
jgi:hypothetical protein